MCTFRHYYVTISTLKIDQNICQITLTIWKYKDLIISPFSAAMLGADVNDDACLYINTLKNIFGNDHTFAEERIEA